MILCSEAQRESLVLGNANTTVLKVEDIGKAMP